MKGVILAGGLGTRLKPLTEVTNKHLLPVFDRPMILHPLETLKQLGIKDICIVTGGEYMADFMRFLGSGTKFGVRLTYKIQDGPLGIAHALLQAEDFFEGEKKIVAILGDNIFEKVNLPKTALEDKYAYVFLKEVNNPERFGVAVFDENGNIIEIEEKPKQPKSNYAVTGLYIYPNDVFDFIKTLKPSARGELEITDVNNWYLKQGRLKAIKLEGYWTDAGTFSSWLKANILRVAMVKPNLLNHIDLKEFLKNLF
ncbi:MAG: spore coat protein [Thermofilum sp. ex4484_82]|nr:MAG: spore coat protein [Thermofilum sp. ex4484_82]OYT35982.1 MAG: spore coat protein [Archaeoglobales archaeon ex4484_92]